MPNKQKLETLLGEHSFFDLYLYICWIKNYVDPNAEHGKSRAVYLLWNFSRIFIDVIDSYANFFRLFPTTQIHVSAMKENIVIELHWAVVVVFFAAVTVVVVVAVGFGLKLPELKTCFIKTKKKTEINLHMK